MHEISIIVPIYNAENYLSECINSILEQSYTNFELILVDDGSTDKSIEICKEFNNKDKRIKYIRKENGGVSSARNVGIRNSSGKYIAFVDSDDYIEKDFLKNLINYDGYDLIIGGYKEFYNHKKGVFIENEKIITLKNNAKDIDNLVYQNKVNILLYFPWNKLYKRSIIVNNNLYFNENLISSEDTIFTIDYLLFSDRIILIPYNNYIYRFFYNIKSKRQISYEKMDVHINILQNSLMSLESKFNCKLNRIRSMIIYSFAGLFKTYLKELDYSSYKSTIKKISKEKRSLILKNILKQKDKLNIIKFIYYKIIFSIPCLGFYLLKK